MNNIFVISVEGVDRIGKCTQTHFLKAVFSNRGYKVKLLEVPVKFSITYLFIFFMLKTGLAATFPRIFHFIQFLNKFIHQVLFFPWYCFNYDILILDRWHGSYYCYGVCSGVKEDSWIMQLYKVFYKPDITLWLAGRPHVHEGRDVYEKDLDLQEKVHNAYHDWMNNNSTKVFEINANQRAYDVHEDIMETIRQERNRQG